MRQKLLRKRLVTHEDYKLCRVELRDCLESVLGNKRESELTLLEVAVNEALNNSYQHGQVKGAMNSIFLSMSLFKPKSDSGCLLIRVKDSGKGFKVEQINDRKDLEEEVSWSESGRGMMIMESVMDRVRYSAKGNSVTMVKEL